LRPVLLGEGADAIVVDIHAEATSEKMAMGHFCDGRASLVVGTHFALPTADAQILRAGTAYQTRRGRLRRLRFRHRHGEVRAGAALQSRRCTAAAFAPATGPATLCAVFVATNAKGFATRIDPVRVGGRLKEALPAL